jgi:AcrR family transcriptional regulator
MTRARILGAAIDEFSAYGLSGARIDRIADAADANKRSIYVYFENKESLFNAALHHVIGALTEAVPVTEDDLPGYAGRMFDYLLSHPEAFRLSAWRQLERPDAGPDESTVFAQKVKAMRVGEPGVTGDLPPMDALILILVMASSWFISPAGLLAADGSDPNSPKRLQAHRAALVEAVRRMVQPPT